MATPGLTPTLSTTSLAGRRREDGATRSSTAASKGGLVQTKPFRAGAKPWRKPNADLAVAKGPATSGAVEASDEGTWLEIRRAGGVRIDTVDSPFHVTLTRETSSGKPGRSRSSVKDVAVTITPEPPSEDTPGGSLLVRLSPLTATGSYRVTVLENGMNIRHSPFALAVQPGPPAELRLLGASGVAAWSIELVAGVEAHAKLVAYDRYGNVCETTAGYRVEVQLQHAPVAKFGCRLADSGNGAFELFAAAEVAGSYAGRALLRAPSKCDSYEPDDVAAKLEVVHEVRFELIVQPAATHAGNSDLVGMPPRLDVGQPCVFDLIARDRFGNRVMRGGETWRLLLLPARGEGGGAEDGGGGAGGGIEPEELGVVDYDDEGCYRLRMVCKVSGVFDLQVHQPGPASIEEPMRRWHLRIYPGPVCLQMSNVDGAGLGRAVAGAWTPVHIVTRDVYGNPTPGPPAKELGPTLVMTALYDGQEAQALSSPGPQRSPSAASPALRSPGVKPAWGSSSSAARPLSPSRSPKGPGLTAESTEWQNGRGWSAGGMSRSSKVTLQPMVEALSRPGHYRALYRLTRSGVVHTEVTCEGTPLRSSSGTLHVVPAPLFMERCLLVASSSTERPPPASLVAGQVWRARLMLRDEFCNPVPAAGRTARGALALVNRPVAARAMALAASSGEELLRDLALGESVPLASSAGGGLDEVLLHAKLKGAGRYCCTLSVDGSSIPAACVWVDVSPGPPCAPLSSLVPGTEVEGAEVRALEPASFAVVLRDVCGNTCTTADGVAASLAPEGAGSVVVKARPGDGFATLTVHSRTVGGVAVHVMVGGAPMPGSPFNLRALPGAAHAPNCVAYGEGLEVARQRERATIHVRTRDSLGNECISGGEGLRATIAPRGGEYGEIVGVRDHANGHYSVDYTVGISARYTVSVLLDGRHIEKSPFSIDVHLDSSASTPRQQQSQLQGMSQQQQSQAELGGSPRRAGADSAAGTPLHERSGAGETFQQLNSQLKQQHRQSQAAKVGFGTTASRMPAAGSQCFGASTMSAPSLRSSAAGPTPRGTAALAAFRAARAASPTSARRKGSGKAETALAAHWDGK